MWPCHVGGSSFSGEWRETSIGDAPCHGPNSPAQVFQAAAPAQQEQPDPPCHSSPAQVFQVAAPVQQEQPGPPTMRLWEERSSAPHTEVFGMVKRDKSGMGQGALSGAVATMAAGELSRTLTGGWSMGESASWGSMHAEAGEGSFRQLALSDPHAPPHPAP